MYTGSCLCSAVSYEVAGPFDRMANCHCSMCRKHHGAMFATFASAPLAGFRWISSADNLAVYKSSEPGNLDGDPGIKPQMHMFAGSRATWFPITDTLPQHQAYPPQFGGGEGLKRPAPAVKPGLTQGSCLCNETAWEFSGLPERVQNCHCSRCRKARSAAHATNAFYKVEQFTWVRGQENVQSYSLQGTKYFGQDFCRHCGSPVPRVVHVTGYVVVPCGTFDSALATLPLGNIFASSKAPWFDITDGLPQWDAYPPRK